MQLDYNYTTVMLYILEKFDHVTLKITFSISKAIRVRVSACSPHRWLVGC